MTVQTADRTQAGTADELGAILARAERPTVPPSRSSGDLTPISEIVPRVFLRLVTGTDHDEAPRA